MHSGRAEADQPHAARPTTPPEAPAGSPRARRLTGPGRSARVAVPNRSGAAGRRPAAGPTGRPATRAAGRTTPPEPHARSWRGVQSRAKLPRARLNFLFREFPIPIGHAGAGERIADVTPAPGGDAGAFDGGTERAGIDDGGGGWRP